MSARNWKYFPAYATRPGSAADYASPEKPATADNFLGSWAALDTNLLHTPLSRPQWELLRNTPMTAIPWSARAAHVFEWAQWRNLGDVFSRSEQDLAGLRNVGKITIHEIAVQLRDFLRSAGAGLGGETDVAAHHVQMVRNFSARPEMIPPGMWQMVVGNLKQPSAPKYTVGLAMSLAGEPWPEERRSEPLAAFLAGTLAEFFQIKGLGRPQKRALCRCLLRLWLHQTTGGGPGPENGDLKIGDLGQVLQDHIQKGRFDRLLAEVFVLGGLSPRQVRVLELRYGLAGRPLLTVAKCAGRLQLTTQRIYHLEGAGLRRLADNPDILRAFHGGLLGIQNKIWQRLAGQSSGQLYQESWTGELARRIGGPETLLIKVCHGNLRQWLDANPAATGPGRPMPV
jgi:hypothetical protein